jgi:hypothetical protein
VASTQVPTAWCPHLSDISGLNIVIDPTISGTVDVAQEVP